MGLGEFTGKSDIIKPFQRNTMIIFMGCDLFQINLPFRAFCAVTVSRNIIKKNSHEIKAVLYNRPLTMFT